MNLDINLSDIYYPLADIQVKFEINRQGRFCVNVDQRYFHERQTDKQTDERTDTESDDVRIFFVTKKKNTKKTNHNAIFIFNLHKISGLTNDHPLTKPLFSKKKIMLNNGMYFCVASVVTTTKLKTFGFQGKSKTKWNKMATFT